MTPLWGGWVRWRAALQENLSNLECVVPDNVPAWQDSQSRNNYINKSKHMTRTRKFGLFLAKSPFSLAKH